MVRALVVTNPGPGKLQSTCKSTTLNWDKAAKTCIECSSNSSSKLVCSKLAPAQWLERTGCSPLGSHSSVTWPWHMSTPRLHPETVSSDSKPDAKLMGCPVASGRSPGNIPAYSEQACRQQWCRASSRWVASKQHLSLQYGSCTGITTYGESIRRTMGMRESKGPKSVEA